MPAHDIAIVGGGPVGLAAALAAAQHGIDVLVLEAQEESPADDPRVFALSHASRLILERLGAWTHLAASQPIRTVHVSERAAFGTVELHAELLGIPALGYVVTYGDLVAALRKRVLDLAIETVTGARVTAVTERQSQSAVRYERNGDPQEIVVAVTAIAEGGAGLAARASIIDREYDQKAIVATVKTELASPDWAYERFTPRGPIALLPVEGAHALIWTVPAREADHLLQIEEDEFERALSAAYGSRIGAVRLRGSRATFALKLRFAHQLGQRVALIGNAAQTLHPVAGQGFNIGLRDAFELAVALASCVDDARDAADGLRAFRSGRRLDRAAGTLFTDMLVRSFTTENPIVGCTRSAALALLDAFEPAKRFLMRRMIFGAPR